MEEKKNYRIDTRVIYKRLVINLIIIFLSVLTGFICYKSFGQLKEDQIIPFYLKNSFGRYNSSSYYNDAVGNIDTSDAFIDYYFKYGDYYESDSVGHPLNDKSPLEDLEEERAADYSVVSNIRDKTLEGTEAYYKDNDFVFFAKGKIENGKVVFDQKDLTKEYKKALIPIINDYLINTIFENQTRYIPVSSPDYDQGKFEALQRSGKAEIQYIYDDKTDDGIAGVNIVTPQYKTADLESFSIGLTRDKFEGNPHLHHPITLVFLYGFLPGLIAMGFLFLIFDSFSNFDNYKDTPVVVAFRKTPIELKVASWFLLVLISSLGINYPGMLIDSDFSQFNYMTAFISITLFSLALIFIERSLILQIKLIYRFGFKKTFIQNSLILKICRWLWAMGKDGVKAFKNWIIKSQGDIGKYSLTRILLIVGAYLLVMSIAHAAKIEFLVIPLTGYLLGRILFSVSKNVEKINSQSTLIAKGNFDEKVDENLPHFNTIANNFNTIGDNINRSVEEKLKAERLKTDLITNVSHDLKTPLTSIISYSSLLKEKDTPDEIKDQYVDVIFEKATKLNNLIEDLFQISKISSNSIEFHKEKIDIVAFMEQVVGEFRDELEKKNMKVVLNVPDYPIYCNLDGQKTYRVFENLITNILKYAQTNTRVYMTVDDGGDKVRITIKNISKYELNISPQELQERFIRADKSRNTEGNGLGLSIASSFVEGQGGSFSMEIDGDLFKTILIFKKTEN
ncbi:HAMP domain-containing sensor histidine kinase [Lagierella sp.]|uniref:HAMP domain-containing sensor histidine kinase n=1 Tax=Lagierella sp. TaxID=2849657 RepID=UPI00260ABB0B|nr:HAMP domain-containing sensor histidine kinase [Lagierella sp.]